MSNIEGGNRGEFEAPFGSTKGEVLYGLRSIHNGKVGEMIVGRCAFTDLYELDVIGRPGAGKSTVIHQIITEVQRISPKTEFFTVSYDDINSDFEMEVGDSSGWTPRRWSELNRRVIAKKEETKQLISQRENKSILLMECPAVGKNDRGMTAIKHSIVEKPDQKLVLALVPDPRTVMFAKGVREYVVQTSDYEGLKSSLEKTFHIVMDQFDDSEESGQQIVEMFSKMAQTRHLESIGKEIELVINDWKMKNVAKSLRMIKDVDLPPILKNQLSFKEHRNLKIEAAYMDYFLLNELNLFRVDSIVAISPYITGKLIHMY